MSVWNSILQATHSALIDELNERFPDDKIELGLPKRFDGFAIPPSSSGADSLPQIQFWEVVSVAEGAGFCAVAGLKSQPAKELADIFAKARIRAEKEFKIRGIAASFGGALKETPRATMTIWLPMAIHWPKETKTFDLALGLGI